MTSFNRQLERAKAKKEHKAFLKKNPKYRALPFAKYLELAKAGLLKDDVPATGLTELKLESGLVAEEANSFLQTPAEDEDDTIAAE